MTICYVPPLFSSILLKVESEIWEAKSGSFWHFGPIWEFGTYSGPDRDLLSLFAAKCLIAQNNEQGDRYRIWNS